MRRNVLNLLVAVMCLALVAGCATVIKPIPAQDLNPKVKSGALVQKTNNFEVIMDTSASMDEPYQWNHFAYTSPMKTTVLEYEQHLVRLFNDTIPNLKLTAGLRDFAGRRMLTRNFDTKLWYGMSPWAKADLEKAIYTVNTAGVESPLDLALDAATMDLKPLAGKSAVIIFSDGLEMPKAVASAQAMKAAMRDNICIYVVQVGPDKITTGLAAGRRQGTAGQGGEGRRVRGPGEREGRGVGSGHGGLCGEDLLRTSSSAASCSGSPRGGSPGGCARCGTGSARGDLL